MFDGSTKCNWPEEITDRVKLNNLIQKASDPSDHPRIVWKPHACEIILGTDFIHAKKGTEKAAKHKTSEFELTNIEVTDLPTRVLRNQIQKQVYKIRNISRPLETSENHLGA
ncbi:unnamed protein product, partial [Allacma fusca]